MKKKKRKKTKKKYRLNIALVSWHAKRGYVLEYIYPKNFTVPQKHLEMLFFYSLHIKQRRVEPLLKSLKIDNREYTFFYYGAFEERPTILIIESNYKTIKPLVQTLAILLRRNKLYRRGEDAISKLDFEGFINLIDDKKIVLILLGLALSTYDVVLQELIENPVIRVSELLEKTNYLQDPFTRMEIENIMKALVWCNLVSFTLDKRVLDFKIRLKSFPFLKVCSSKKDEIEFEQLLANPKLLKDNLQLLKELSLILLNRHLNKLLCRAIQGKLSLKKISEDSIRDEILKFAKKLGILSKDQALKEPHQIKIMIVDIRKKTPIREAKIC